MKNKGISLFFYFCNQCLIPIIKLVLRRIILILSFSLSIFVLAQPYRLDDTTLSSTSSDKSRLSYKIKTPRATLAQIKLHQFLSQNPKAFYMLDQYEKTRNKEEVEKAHNRIKRNDFLQNILPVVQADVRATGRFSKNLNRIPFLKDLGISLGVEGGVSVSKTWTSEELVKNIFSRQYTQGIDGTIDSKINIFSKNLTHDIYECESQPNSCRLNTDPAFQYLYEVVFKKDFADFPDLEKKEKSQRIYASFEELKLKSPKKSVFSGKCIYCCRNF